MRLSGLVLALGCFVFSFYATNQSQPDLGARKPAQAPFHSATLEEMANPRCLNQDHVQRNDLKKFLKKYSDISKLELPAVTEVAGIRFENEHPELIYRFMQLVTAPEGNVFANSDLKPEMIKKAFGKPNGCNKVLCAVRRLFGQVEGPLILLLLTEYDLNLSHFVWKNASPWKVAEIRDIMKAIETTPSNLLPLDLNKKLIHFKRGMQYENGDNTVANATIEIFDVWNQEEAPIRQYSLYHEFSHNWAKMHANNIDVSPEWLRISGWESQKDLHSVTDWTMHPGTQQVSIYAKTNPFEDFAESVSAYRYAPQKLKEVSLDKYNFVKDVVYGGMEFSSDFCPFNSDFDMKYSLEFADYDQGASPEFITETAAKCFPKNIGLVKDPSLKTGFLSCLSLNAATEVLRIHGQLHDDSNKPLALYDVLGEARVRFPNIERGGAEELKRLLVKLLAPHAANMQKAIRSANCDFAYDASLLEQQAKSLNVKNYELYFGVSELSKKVCLKHIETKQSKVNAGSIGAALKGYF